LPVVARAFDNQNVKRLLVATVLGCTLTLVPSAAASPTVRLAILHVMRGCHVWGTQDSRPLGATRTLVIKPGTKLEIRINCPMAFDVVQLAGPKVIDPSRWQTGTSHTIRFARRGLYKLQAVNVQSSEEMNLQTMGSDNALLLTVRVR
jgi:hypothetical protein